VLGVIPAGRDTDERPSCRRGTMRVWSAHATDNPKPSGRSAEHGIAADRFAREIVRFLKSSRGALAAAECHPVGPRCAGAILQT
jgi:hypothetical protein